MATSFAIDNRLPVGARADWLIGAGATPAEKVLMYGTAVAGAALVWFLWQREGVTGWSWWQVGLALLFALDLFGGAMSNAASSTKRQYQAPLPPRASPLARLAHSPMGFSALHIYPFVVVALYPGGSLWWAIGWYAAMLVAVYLLTYVTPGYLQRPAAMTIFVVSVPIALAFESPPGWAWLPFVFTAKLVLGHAVHEEAYRPTASAD
jgi:hypothetical protein